MSRKILRMVLLMCGVHSLIAVHAATIYTAEWWFVSAVGAAFFVAHSNTEKRR